LNIDLAKGRRFDALLRGEGIAPCDQALFKQQDWLVAPTVGAIIPNWLLLIPRRPALNFVEWATLESKRPESLIAEVRSYLGLRAADLLWFEHGPKAQGAAVGCGLDHAHIHLLIRPPFTFVEFASAAKALSRFDWRASGTGDAFAEVDSQSSYLIAGCGEHTTMASGVEIAGSQFFRRVVAVLASKATTWDYRLFPHVENVEASISTFRFLERMARRHGE
jgi:ATP adenylyltransferase